MRFVIIVLSVLCIGNHLDCQDLSYQKGVSFINGSFTVIEINNDSSMVKNLSLNKSLNLAQPNIGLHDLIFEVGYLESNCQIKGLLVNDNIELQSLDDKLNESGNFYFLDNAIICNLDNRICCVFKDEYKKIVNPNYMWAFQSGPILVRNKIQTPVNKTSINYAYRSSLGIRDNKLFIVVSECPVSFWNISEFMKSYLQCNDAIALNSNLCRYKLPGEFDIVDFNFKDDLCYYLKLNLSK